MVTVLTNTSEFECDESEGGLWTSAQAMSSQLDWALKPEGFCQGDTCVPIPSDRVNEFVQDDKVNLSAFWQHLGRPIVSSTGGDITVLGESAGERNDALLSLSAPDFTLPDFNGKLHSLTDFRRQRVLLITWASW
ncbi:MAG: hypothetical protein JJ956_07815 [Pseudomonadales bacterium]|nr:hypothetical protein [Pseudomonadales bacterium]